MENPQNIELSQCLKSINNLGSTVYQNLCTGTSQTVPWGALDWMVLAFFGIIVLAISAAVYHMLSDF